LNTVEFPERLKVSLGTHPGAPGLGFARKEHAIQRLKQAREAEASDLPTPLASSGAVRTNNAAKAQLA